MFLFHYCGAIIRVGMKGILLRLYQRLIAFGRLVQRILSAEGEDFEQKYHGTPEGCLIQLTAFLFILTIFLVIMALSSDVIKNIPYKVELMQALLVASAAIMSLCGVFVGGTKLLRATAISRNLMLPLYFSLVIGLITIMSTVNWLILAEDILLVITLVLFSLQICSFAFGIFMRLPPRD